MVTCPRIGAGSTVGQAIGRNGGEACFPRAPARSPSRSGARRSPGGRRRARHSSDQGGRRIPLPGATAQDYLIPHSTARIQRTVATAHVGRDRDPCPRSRSRREVFDTVPAWTERYSCCASQARVTRTPCRPRSTQPTDPRRYGAPSSIDGDKSPRLGVRWATVAVMDQSVHRGVTPS